MCIDMHMCVGICVCISCHNSLLLDVIDVVLLNLTTASPQIAVESLTLAGVNE